VPVSALHDYTLGHIDMLLRAASGGAALPAAVAAPRLVDWAAEQTLPLGWPPAPAFRRPELGWSGWYLSHGLYRFRGPSSCLGSASSSRAQRGPHFLPRERPLAGRCGVSAKTCGFESIKTTER